MIRESVTGALSWIICRTFSGVRSDSPKSPRTTCSTNVTYCLGRESLFRSYAEFRFGATLAWRFEPGWLRGRAKKMMKQMSVISQARMTAHTSRLNTNAST